MFLNDAFYTHWKILETESGALFSDGDFNGNGSVGVLDDAFQLITNLGTSVVPTEIVGFQRDNAATEAIENTRNAQIKFKRSA